MVDALKNGSKVHDSLFWQPAEPVEGMLTDPAPAAYYVRAAGIAPAVVEAIYGRGRVVDEHFDGCSYLVEQADAKAMAEAARKVETVGGSVKLVLKKLPRMHEKRGRTMKIKVSVPATSANVGSGFDALGLAVEDVACVKYLCGGSRS